MSGCSRSSVADHMQYGPMLSKKPWIVVTSMMNLDTFLQALDGDHPRHQLDRSNLSKALTQDLCQLLGDEKAAEKSSIMAYSTWPTVFICLSKRTDNTLKVSRLDSEQISSSFPIRYEVNHPWDEPGSLPKMQDGQVERYKVDVKATLKDHPLSMSYDADAGWSWKKLCDELHTTSQPSEAG